MVNKVRVNIAGTPYAIATTDSEKYIQALAKKLDEDITKLLDENGKVQVQYGDPVDGLSTEELSEHMTSDVSFRKSASNVRL